MDWRNWNATAAGLSGVDVVTGDASLTDHYAGMVPALAEQT